MPVSPLAVISERARVGANVTVGPFAVIGEAVIGDGCVIHPHVVIADGVRLGREVEVFPGAFLGKEPKGAGAVARKPEFEPVLHVGDGCSIGPHAVLFYDVHIGSHTLLGDGASIREKCRIGSRCIISRYVTVNYNTTIGDGTKIMDGTHITGNARLGEGVFVSALVGTANDNLMRAGYGGHVVGPTLEDGCVVGLGASILPAVTIGKDATVGAGAVVSRTVEAGCVAIGVPARTVRPAPARPDTGEGAVDPD